MNLLLIGAGGHGMVVKEAAASIYEFEKIDFLDDKSDLAIGKLEDYKKLRNDYIYAFVALGNNELRSIWTTKLIEIGYKIPIIIHSSSYVSPSSVIEAGTIVLPRAVINTNVTIRQGSIIGMGSLIDHDSIINEFCHINTGSIIKAGCTVKKYTKIDAGVVFSGKKHI